MPEQLYASGGIVVPAPPEFDAWWRGDGIRDNGVAPRWRNRTLKGRIRNFFAWDKDWGLRLRGGPFPRIRDMMPACTTSRGGIRFG